MFFWNSLAFSMIQRILAIWSLVPLPFLNPAWTSRSSWFRYWIYFSPPQKTGWKNWFALKANWSTYIWTDTAKYSFKFDVLNNFASLVFVLSIYSSFGHATQGILVPWPRTELVSRAVESYTLDHQGSPCFGAYHLSDFVQVQQILHIR